LGFIKREGDLLAKSKGLVERLKLSTWRADKLQEDTDMQGYKQLEPLHPETDWDKINLIGSRVVGTMNRHRPIFDFDFPVTVVESSTPGRYHVYLHRQISWEQYEAILDAMEDAKLLNPGWVRSAVAHQCATLRPLHVIKDHYWQKRLDLLGAISKKRK